jgi:uncharacterized membrane protein YcaP (DUF421 family)
VAYASSRSALFYRITTNTPRLLYDGSRFLEENLRAERMTREDVLAKVREGGHPTLESVAAVVLETTGNVAVIGSSVPSEPAAARRGRHGPGGPTLRRIRQIQALFTGVRGRVILRSPFARSWVSALW